MPTNRTKGSHKPSDESVSKDSKFLDKVVDLLSIPVKKYKSELDIASPTKNNQSTNRSAQVTFHYESKLLRQFWSKYKDERCFSQLPDVEKFLKILRDLIKTRLRNSYWNENATLENFYRLFQCLRVLLRDQNFQNELHALDGLPVIAKNLHSFSKNHMSYNSDELVTDILKEITNICQKLSAETHQRMIVVNHGIHKSLVLLLSSNDVLVLHLTLYALIGLTKSEEPKAIICELNCVEILIQIVEDYDVTSKQLAVTLLRQLCTDLSIREQVKVFHGIPVLLSLLRSDTLKLLWNVVWILVQLAEDSDTSNEIRLLGGIPLLIALLQNGEYAVEEKNLEGSTSIESVPIEQKLSLKAAVCAALTELVLNDINARHVVQANGIYLVAMLVFFEQGDGGDHIKSAEQQLQKNAFRALRFLFSMERNRQLFKRLFPVELFEIFIDVGHYQKDLDSYSHLVDSFNSLPEHDLLEMKQRVQETNQNKAPSSYIQQYAVYEHLGSGAFGSVYKVKRQGGQTFLAMKEIPTHRPEFGKSMKERHDSVDSIINECSFVKKQLNHTNIVKYHKAFMEGDKLYIIMDLIDGAPIGEHFNSLKEKGQMFTEERIWDIFVQMVLALRYIHKEKFIVHRDLTPNNIMLGENDKVTITDFGLARQKNPDASNLRSMVGTILYSCPEVVKGLPYGEKADIWGIGCILYQMATLAPPFNSTNMLSLATKIVEAEYEPLPENIYSTKLSLVIRRCLTVKAEDRPDILEVAGIIPDILMGHLERLRVHNTTMEKKLEKEKRRVEKHTAHMKNQRIMYNENHFDSFSESSTSKTLDSVFGDNGQTDSEVSDEQKNTVNGRYDRAHTHPEEVTKPIQINRKLKFEHASSLIDGNDDEIFRRPRTPPRKLLPIENGRHQSQTDLGPVIVEKDNIKRTQSCSYIDNMKTGMARTPQKYRPISAHPTLSISPRKVREINDPVLQMLGQLHKILYISQLPPSLKFDPNRRLIDQYKKSLFSTPSSAMHLKNELKKLLEGSKEQVDVQMGHTTNFSSSSTNLNEHALGVTYEDLQSILDKCLMKTGYFNIPPTHRIKPLAPIGAHASNKDVT